MIEVYRNFVAIEDNSKTEKGQYEESLVADKIPPTWKNACVIATHKNRVTDIYLPKSLTSTFCKL